MRCSTFVTRRGPVGGPDGVTGGRYWSLACWRTLGLAAWVCASLALTALAPTAAQAQLVTWDVTSGLWNDTGSWQGGVVPLGTGTAIFSGTSVGSQNIAVLLSGATEIRGLSFNNTGAATIQSDSPTDQALTLGTGGLTMSATAGPVTIGASGSAVNLLLSGTQAWTNNSLTSLLSILGTIDTPTATDARLTVAGVGTTSIAGDILGDAGRVISLTKAGNGTLILSGSNSYSGGTTLSAGILRMGDASSLGTGTTTVSSGATLDLAGFSTGVPLRVAGSGLSGNYQRNTLGAIINASTTSASTISGSVTFTGTTSIGGMGVGYARPSTAAATIPTAGAGDITLSGPISGEFPLTKVGDNRLFITGSAAYAGATVINNGSLVLSGSGVLWNNTGITVNPNASLVFDNSGGFAAVNRTGTVARRPITLNAGTLNLFGASVSGTESLGTGSLSSNSGFNIVTLSDSAGTGLVLSGSTISQAGTSGILIRGDNLGGGAPGPDVTNVILTTAPATIGRTGADNQPDKRISPWAIVDQSADGSGTSFMAHSASTGVRPLLAGEYDTVGAVSSAANNNNWYLSGDAGSSTAGQNVSPNSLTLQGSAAVTLGNRSILQPQSGGILAYGTGNEISGGQGFISSSNNNNLFLAVAGSTSRLTISSPLGYTSTAVANAINKYGDGELVLSAKGFLPRSVVVNSGTLTLDGGVNTLAYAVTTPPAASGANTGIPGGSNLFVRSGGVLDLNGNNQAFTNLNGDVGSTALPDSGGMITNSSETAATLTVNAQLGTTKVTSGTFAGSIAGNLNFSRGGMFSLIFTGANTYTGSTVVAGQGTTLQDLGTFANTSRVTIAGTPLSWNDGGLAAVANRLPSTAPIDLSGGSLSWSSRAGLASAISTGTVTPVAGNSGLSVSVGASGAGTMTIAGLGDRSTGATLTFSGNGTLGGSGTNAGILVTANPSVTSGIVGGWALTNGVNPAGGSGAFVTYDPVLGIRPLGTYSTLAQMASGSNVRVTANSAFASGTTVGNSLTVSNATLSFGSPTDMVNLESGGILFQTASTLGASAGSGRLTAGGLTAYSGTSELFVHALAAGTLNSSVVDNPAGAAVALVIGQAATTVTLTGSNTHSGGTYLNAVTAVLSSPAGFAIPGDLSFTGGGSGQTVRWTSSDQMAPTGAITVRGGQINLNGFSNSVAGLTIVNDRHVASVQDTNANPITLNGFVPPAVLTSTGTLTLTGPISVPNPTQAALIPLIAGNLDLGGGSRTMTVDPVAGVPNQIGLAINAGMKNGSLVSTGSGVVFLGGVSGSTASYTANAGTLVLGNTGFLGGRVTLGSAATLDMRGGSFTIGSLAGSGTVTNDTTSLAANTPGSLTFGVDNTTTTFSGVFTNFVNTLPGTLTGMPLNLTKIGTGTTTFTGNIATVDTGTFTISQGGVVFSGPVTSAFNNAVAVNAGGALVLDNASTAVNNRLGGPTLLAAATARGAATLNGGGLRLVGNNAAAVSETVSVLTLGSGGSVVTFDAAGTQGITLTSGSLFAQGGQSSALIRGIDGTAGAGVGTLVATTIAYAANPNGAVGSQTMSIRPDILVDPSPTGLGTGFAVRDPATNQLRAIAAAELSGTLGTPGTTGNYALSTIQSATGSQTVNSLTLNSGGGVAAGSANSQLTVSSGGILAFAGNTGLGTGRVTTGGAKTMVFQTPGTGTLGLNGSIVNSTAGIVKAGDGTLVLGGRQYYSSSTTINGGTLRLNAGDNTIPVTTTSATPGVLGLYANGGTFDMNGATQLVERVQSVGTLPGTGGVITGSAGSRLVSVTAASTTFAGTITGSVEFQKAGTGVLTMVSGNDMTGGLVVRGGGLTLRDSGAFSAASAVTVNQATLTLDDTGLSSISNRLGSVPLTFSGGGLNVLSRQSTQAAYTISSLSLAGGQSQITLTPAAGGTASGSMLDVVISSLSRTPTAVLNMDASTFRYQASGNWQLTNGLNTNGTRVTLTGQTNTNDILGGWATVDGMSNWATVDAQGVVGGLGRTGFPSFSANSISGTTNTASMNINATASASNIPTQTINSFRSVIHGSGTFTLGSSGSASTLTLASGGLLVVNYGGGHRFADGAAAAGGSALTSGADNLFVNVARPAPNTGSGSANIGVRIANNGGNAIGLVKSGPGALTLSATANTYTGTTVVNSGGVTLNSAAGGVLIPGDLVIGFGATPAASIAVTAAVTMTGSAGQIDSTSNVTIGNGSLTLTGTNTLASLTFDNIGGASTPTVMAAARLNLSSSNAITAMNDNPATTPTISGTSLAFTSTTPPVINTSGLSPLDLLISATITSATGGPITKTGAGSLVLSAANTFDTGVNLSAGSIYVDNNSALGTGPLTIGANTNLQSLSAVQTLANNVSVAGDFSLGGTDGANNIALSGTVDLGGSRRTITVADIISTGSLSGVVTGAGGITKAGNGTLALSGSSTFSGGVTLSAGQLVLGNNAALGTGTFAISGGWFNVTAARTTTNNNPQAWNGDLLFLGSYTLDLGSGTVTLGTSPTVNVAASTLTVGGPIEGSGYGLTKVGNGTLVLSGSSTYSGPTTINAGQITASNAFALGDGAANLTINAGALSIGSGMNVTRSGSITLSSGTISSGTLTMNGSALDAQSGLISTALAGSAGVRKTTSGTVTLSGSNSFAGGTTVDSGLLSITGTSTGAGPTTVNGGRLAINRPGGLYAGVTDNWTKENITVGSDGILSVQVGTSNFTTSNMTTLLTNLGATGNAVNNNGFLAGSTIGIDTTPGNFTLSTAIVDSTGSGGGAIGLVKYGNNTLALTGSNTFTGTTSITAGVLTIGPGGSLAGPIVNDAALTVTNATAVLPGRITGAGLFTVWDNVSSVLLSHPDSLLAGPITIRSGRLEYAGGLAGSGTISIGQTTATGTFRYIGSGLATDRVINLAGTTGGGVLDASGSGALDLEEGTVTAAATGKNLTLTGTSTAINTIGAIPSPVVNVDKTGPGLWRLSGASSFTGRLSVLDGTIVAAVGAPSSGNGVFGQATGDAELPLIGDPADGATGQAAVLLESGVTVSRGLVIAGLGSGATQQAILGTVAASGTATFANGMSISLGRDLTLQAADGGTVEFLNVWAGASGTAGPPPAVAFNIGSAGNTGTVVFDTFLPESITAVNVRRGTLRLDFEDEVGATIGFATPVTLGESGGSGTLDINGIGQPLGNLMFAGVNSTALGSGTLRLFNSGSAAAVGVTGTGHTISVPVALDNAATFTVESLSRLNISSVIANGTNGPRGLTKAGPGILELSGANTFTGTTTVSAGTLVVNGSLAQGALSVAAGATLMGSGTIGGAATIFGIHEPGNSAAVQTFADLTYSGSTAQVIWELWGNTATQTSPTAVFDQIVVSGTLDFADPTSLTLSFGTTAGGSAVAWSDPFWNSEKTWTLYDVGAGGTTTGFSNFSLVGDPSTWLDASGQSLVSVRPQGNFSVAQQGSDVTISYVPEPASLVLAGLGLFGLAAATAGRRSWPAVRPGAVRGRRRASCRGRRA